MNKTWFHKLLFSYLPVFFVVISFLIAVFFFSMGQVTRLAAETVNRGSAAHALEVVDHSLRSIEGMMIKELMETGGVQHFFNQTLWDEPYLRMVRPSEKLRDIVTQFPTIRSAYMVRWEDETVLSDDSAMPLSMFEDAAFVQAYREGREGAHWTGVRLYKELHNQNPIRVVTLVKPYPLPAGEEGIMVVNVSAFAIEELVKDLYDSGFIQARLLDQAGETLYAASGGDDESFPGGGALTEARSEYTGWTIQSRLQGGVGALYPFASTFSVVLLASGFVAILGAVLFITYISKRHYRPIASLTERVHGYAAVKAEQLLRNGGKDEFAFLEQALDQIIERSDELLEQQEEHLQIRKRQWIKETLEGDYGTVAGTSWIEGAQTYGWDGEPRFKAVVVVVEIDRYMDFCEQYSKRDQSLLKFLLANVATEIALQRGFAIFGEWLQAHKWSAFLQLTDGRTAEEAALFARQVVSWIGDNVNFTVTIGLGEPALAPEDISLSYEQSLHALQYKSTLGNGRVIGHWEVPESTEAAHRAAAGDMRALVQAVKLGDPAWRAHYDRFAASLRTGIATKEELRQEVNFLAFQLTLELTELNAEYERVWSEQALPRLHRTIKGFDTLDELLDGVGVVLEDTVQSIAALREDRAYSSTMKQVRQYIADHYDNADLSLNHLSAAFELNPKYVSHLFKEEFGEKFVEYVANVRMEKAKELLASTELSIQEVALKVGYTHSFSFIRVFKKHVGMTPGDYRKRMHG